MLHRPLLTACLAALLGCGREDGDTAADPAFEPDAGELADVRTYEPPPQPMPATAERVDAVLRELGPDATHLTELVRDATAAESREILVAMGPKARASLRRHNVRVVQLARHLRGGVL